MEVIVSVIKKELIYIFRDMRTIVLAVLSPIVFICAYGFYGINILNSSINIEENILIVKFILAMILTMLMFLSILTGALELGTGEKEKGTLSSILRTGVEFKYILLGKFFSLVLQGLVSLLIIDANIIIMVFIPNNVFNTLANTIDFYGFIMMANVVLIISVMFFCSIELLVSFVSRNFKEGQLLSFPVMFLILIPFYYIMVFGTHSFNGSYIYSVPFINIPILFENIISNQLELSDLGMFCTSNLLIIYFIINQLIIKIINKEANIIRR